MATTVNFGMGAEVAQQAMPTDLRDQHNVVIKRLENGYMVTVGCKHFVFNKLGDLTLAIAEFYTDPEKAMKKYCRKEGE